MGQKLVIRRTARVKKKTVKPKKVAVKKMLENQDKPKE